MKGLVILALLGAGLPFLSAVTQDWLNVDCSSTNKCPQNSYCYKPLGCDTGRCVCMWGYEEDSNECVKDDVELGDECTSSDQCTDYATCVTSGATKVCECDVRVHPLNSTRCCENQNTCEADYDEGCNDADVECYGELMCLSATNKCGCDPDSYKSTYSRDISSCIKPGLGENCVPGTDMDTEGCDDMAYEHLTCDGGMCVCTDGTKNNDTECVYYGHGQACDGSSKVCDQDLGLKCISGTCQCEDSTKQYFHKIHFQGCYETSTTVDIAEGQACDEDDGPYRVCQEELQCLKCPMDDNDVCRYSHRMEFPKATHNKTCHASVSCDPDLRLVCIGGTCQCSEDTEWVELFQSCFKTVTEANENEMCTMEVTSTTEEVTVCASGLSCAETSAVDDSPICKTAATGTGDECDSITKPCDASRYLECEDSMCQCRAYYVWDTDRCVMADDDDCGGTICDGNLYLECRDNQCQCMDDYVMDGDRCVDSASGFSKTETILIISIYAVVSILFAKF